MREEILVVALGEVRPLVRAARFAALESRLEDRLRDVQHVRKLHGSSQFGIECVTVIIERNFPVPFLQLPKFRGGAFECGPVAVDSSTLFHGPLHLFAQRGNALSAVRTGNSASLAQKVPFQAALLVASLRENGGSRFRGGLRGEGGRAFSRPRAEYQAFRQRV